MNHQNLGRTGLSVSRVSMGCWGLANQMGTISRKQAVDTVHAALDAGVNLFDTADNYGAGLSESILGEALRGRRQQLCIATKVGNLGREPGGRPPDMTVESVVSSCHASLRRLGVDEIDVYQCHQWDARRPEVFVEAFELLKQQGKIRHWGVSTDDTELLRQFDALGDCETCQIRYHVFDRRAESEMLPYCRRHGIGVLVRDPLAKGILTGKFTPQTRFPEDDTVRRKLNEEPYRSEFIAALGRVDLLRELTGEDLNLVDLALGFILAHPAVTCAIPGMKSPEQARQNAAAAAAHLSPATIRAVDAISPPPA